MTTTAGGLLALALVLATAGGGGALARLLRQPTVVGTICAGLVLGSILGWLPARGLADSVWPDVRSQLHLLAQLGLLLFMFEVGRELRSSGSPLAPARFGGVLVLAFAIPLVLGGLAAWPGLDLLTGPQGSGGAALAFVALASAVTAVPVLASILREWQASSGRVAVLALTTATVNDGVVWVGVVILIAVSGDPPSAGMTLACLSFLLLLLLAVARSGPALRRLGARGVVTAIVIVAGLAAASTELMGLHISIGALLVGVVMPAGLPTAERACARLHEVSVAVLLPVFFVEASMNAPVQLLVTLGPSASAAAVTLVLAGALGKLASGVVAGQLAHLDRGRSVALGVLLNCRGVTELAIASIGLQQGLISRFGFAALAVLAVVTTAATAPMLALLDRFGVSWRDAGERPHPPRRPPPGSTVPASAVAATRIGKDLP